MTEIIIAASPTQTQQRRASAMYFVAFAGYAAIAPFFALYLQSIGFSGTQIGSILGIGPLVSLFATPFWTAMADAYKKHRLILMGGTVAIIIGNFLIPFLHTYFLILAIQFAISMFASQVFPLQDSATVHMLGKEQDRYGRIRLWGTIGWGLGAPIAGFALNRFGLAWMFWIYAGMMLVCLYLVSPMKFDVRSETGSFLGHIRDFLKDSRWLLFLLTVFLCGVGSSAQGNYISLLLNKLGANQLLGFALSTSAMVGITLTVSTIFEAPVMLFSRVLISRLGNRGLMLIAISVIALRNLLYAVVTSPTQVVLIQLLHGLTFPALWLAGVNYVSKRAPAGLHATAQGLFSIILMGLGWGVGNFLGGVFLDLVGLQGMFAVMGAISFLSALVFLFIRNLIFPLASSAPQGA